jgi:hypothetical protein
MAMVVQHIQMLANNNKKCHKVFGRQIVILSFFLAHYITWHMHGGCIYNTFNDIVLFLEKINDKIKWRPYYKNMFFK